MTESENATWPVDVTAPDPADEAPDPADEHADPTDLSRPAVQRIAAAAAAVEGVADLPLAEHAERYQQLHATLQTELGAIAQL